MARRLRSGTAAALDQPPGTVIDPARGRAEVLPRIPADHLPTAVPVSVDPVAGDRSRTRVQVRASFRCSSGRFPRAPSQASGLALLSSSSAPEFERHASHMGDFSRDPSCVPPSRPEVGSRVRERARTVPGDFIQIPSGSSSVPTTDTPHAAQDGADQAEPAEPDGDPPRGSPLSFSALWLSKRRG